MDARCQKRLTIVSLDESFLLYDSPIRRVWIEEKKRPVARITGSHKHSCPFGAISIDGKQLSRQYDKFNGDTFPESFHDAVFSWIKQHLTTGQER